MAKPSKPSGGRKRGSRNIGYWYRTGRGWFVTEGETFVRLLDSNGNPIRDKEATREGKNGFQNRHRCGNGP